VGINVHVHLRLDACLAQDTLVYDTVVAQRVPAGDLEVGWREPGVRVEEEGGCAGVQVRLAIRGIVFWKNVFILGEGSIDRWKRENVLRRSNMRSAGRMGASLFSTAAVSSGWYLMNGSASASAPTPTSDPNETTHFSG
jgi:hypothetical protein